LQPCGPSESEGGGRCGCCQSRPGSLGLSEECALEHCEDKKIRIELW
jgi:hypothetical protein